MTLADFKTAPQPFDPAQDFTGPLAPLLAGVAGCSPYLGGLIARERDWLDGVANLDPAAVLPALTARLAHDSPDLPAHLRQAKGRAHLYTALADCGGVWDLGQVTGALTGFADACVTLALTEAVAAELRRDRLPGATPDDLATAAGCVIFAMGKMGAGELNYSSDIDLICLFNEVRYPGDETTARAAFVRAIRRMTATLSDIRPGGYVFRTDLRLRPDASVTPVCLSMAAAEAYYEAEGRTWERAAWIKARPVAGDIEAGLRFQRTLVPFVWRRHLDYAAIQDAHDMRLRIRDHRRLHGIGVEGQNLKLGPGGIREIEFFTQTRQLIAGGRDPSLRDPATCGGLARLADRGWVPPDVATDLTAAYADLRRIEHRLQMVNDAQTHDMPATAEGVARIAAFCGMDDTAFRRHLTDRLRQVDSITSGFFAPGPATTHAPLPPEAEAIISAWPRYPALRSDRAQAIFSRLRPALFARLSRAGDPQGALVALDGFLAGLPAGVQLFSLFEANPALIDLIVDIAATAPALALHLSRNAGVLDAVIGGSFFADWPGEAALTADLTRSLSQADGFEAQLNAARVWQREAHFRVGVHHLRGLVPATEAATQYADVAGATVTALWPVVLAEVARRHGPPPGRGAALVGMGSLGARWLNAGSDLDLILIYDEAGVDLSDGPRPLPPRAWYAKATQTLVTALSAPMAEGRAYEVDMRLRPSGRQGPVAVSWSAFQAYQRDEAWTWEHLALTRARAVAGNAALAADVEAFRRDLLAAKGRLPRVRPDVADMRARLFAARPAQAAWEAKHGPGRLMDIDMAGQMLALQAGSPDRSPDAQLAGHAALLAARGLFWTLQAALRLLSAGPDPTALSDGSSAFVLRQTGAATVDALTEQLDSAASAAASIIDRLVEG